MTAPIPQRSGAPSSPVLPAPDDAAPRESQSRPPTVRNLSAALRSTLRRWQFWLLLVIIGVLFSVVVQLLSVEDQERYGLNNTELDGYAAIAAVLEDQGVEIHPASTAESARALLEDLPEASIVVHEDRWEASRSLTRDLRSQDRPRVWITPSAATREEALGGLAPARAIPHSSTTDVPEVLDAGEDCTVPAAQRAETIRAPGQLYDVKAGCFLGRPDPTQDDVGRVLAATDAGLVFGAPDAFTNRHITSEGNAALALGLFGEQSDLIWYTPSGVDTLSADEWASPWDFMPDWVDMLTWWLFVCALLLILVAGRRHGPVVVEPLPVEVPASESAEGRGRLYQQADASTEASRTLRSAHLLRLARLLRLGPGTPEQQVIGAVAAQTGRSEQEIARTVDAAAVSGNTAMVRYAQGLAALEDEVRIRLGHGPRQILRPSQTPPAPQDAAASHDGPTPHEDPTPPTTPREEAP
ncbi:hypothetical protein Q7C18_00585 [Nesterenkonia sp. CL21]|uniref:DUF4350 domain-containing protein n=1 Tax=Nesterenkonia sp. CL21 TaxID=3064894 RepID=UPI00287A7C01|nr:DUF4350 domain-containing protein [Nesterenkonia sp. CL21]MDS2171193.1 hypothetical protein [Nesterenkonia sp. CL21]